MKNSIHKKFIEVEQKLKLFDFITSDKVVVWQIFRYDIYKILTSTNSKRKLRTRNNIFFILKIFYSHFRFLFTNPNYLFVGSSRNINNKNRDLSYEFLKEAILEKDKLIFCETNISSLTNSYNAIYSLDPVLKFFSSRFFHLNIEEKEIIDNLYSLLSQNFNLKTLKKEELYAIFTHFKYQSKYYYHLLRLNKIKKVFFVKNGNSYGLIHSSRKLGIKIHEFQHGDIVFEDVTMNFNNIDSKNLLIPDVHFVYSNYWVKNIETHSKCVEIGYNGAGFNNNINLFSQGIVIAMDHNNESFFCDLTKALAEKVDTIVYLKLHPVQFDKFIIFQNLFSQYKNVEVLSFEYNFNQISSKVVSIIGSYSTAMYEAYDFGCQLFIINQSAKSYNFPNEEGVYYFKSILDLITNFEFNDRKRINRSKFFFKTKDVNTLRNEI